VSPIGNCPRVPPRCGGTGDVASLRSGGGEQEGGGSWAWPFTEDLYAIAYRLYAVNDGAHPQYQQPSPNKRCIASPKDLQNGKEKTTSQLR